MSGKDETPNCTYYKISIAWQCDTILKILPHHNAMPTRPIQTLNCYCAILGFPQHALYNSCVCILVCVVKAKLIYLKVSPCALCHDISTSVSQYIIIPKKKLKTITWVNSLPHAKRSSLIIYNQLFKNKFWRLSPIGDQFTFVNSNVLNLAKSPKQKITECHSKSFH